MAVSYPFSTQLSRNQQDHHDPIFSDWRLRSAGPLALGLAPQNPPYHRWIKSRGLCSDLLPLISSLLERALQYIKWPQCIPGAASRQCTPRQMFSTVWRTDHWGRYTSWHLSGKTQCFGWGGGGRDDEFWRGLRTRVLDFSGKFGWDAREIIKENFRALVMGNKKLPLGRSCSGFCI